MRQEALVAAGGGLGDVVMTTPVVAAAYQLGYTVDMLIKGDIACSKELLEPWEVIRDIYIDEPPEGKKYDIVIRAWWHRDVKLDCGEEVMADRMSLRTNHEIIANMGAVRKLGFVGPTPPTYVPVNGRYTTTPLPEHYIVLCPGYSGKRGRNFWRRKAWPHWAEFAQIGEELSFVVLGSKSDLIHGLSVNGPNIIDLVGKTSVTEAASILSRADYVVSLDNGLAHVSAALGRPVYVLFGATSEVKSRPLGREVTVVSRDLSCRPCQMTDAWRSCKSWKCMTEMTPEFVWSIIKESRNA